MQSCHSCPSYRGASRRVAQRRSSRKCVLGRNPNNSRNSKMDRTINTGARWTVVRPQSRLPASPLAMLASLWRHRKLIGEMARREVVGRYKGSVLGIAWSLVQPLVMLLIYTFVFSGVFKARWGGNSQESHAQFAIVLFAGLLVQGLFAEVVTKAPGLVLNNVNYVKKVVFPLEILPAVTLLGAVFHTVVSTLVLLGASAVFQGGIPWTAAFLPVVLLPLAFVVLGLSWVLSSLGVFVRDVGPTVALVTTGMTFLAPVFYPVSAVPAAFRPWLLANPLTFIIEQARAVLVWGQMPDWAGLATYAAIGMFAAGLGYAWFQRTRKGFADVL